MRYVLAFTCTVPAILSACANITPRQIAEPGDITLEEAVASVDRSITYLQEQENKRKVGLALDEVEIVFDVSAKANANNSATLTLADVPVATAGTLGLNATTGLTNDANRGNRITLKFKNLATADLTKGILAQDAAARRRVAETITGPGTVIRSAPRPQR